MVNVSSNAIEELKVATRGQVLLPAAPGFEEARHIWNAMIDRHPALIVRCAGVADVRRSVAFARDNGLPLAVRGGGHNIAGSAICDDGLVVAVWLTDDADKTKDYLPVAQQSLQFQATALACFTGGKAGPEGWGGNADAHATAVVAAGEKVAATFGYRSMNETDVPGVRDALKEARKEK